jgi:hypothetical protein
MIQLLTLLLVAVIFWMLALDRADRARDRAERAHDRAERAHERAEFREELRTGLLGTENRLRARMGRLLTQEAYASAQRCVFALSRVARGPAVGVGVMCVKQGSAITAAHNLFENPLDDVPPPFVFGKVYPLDTQSKGTMLKLEVLWVDKKLDVAGLRVVMPRTYPHFLECYAGPPLSLAGDTLALCAFQLAIQEDLPEFSCSLGVMSAGGVKLSTNSRHLLYSCTTWAGDSGAALLLQDGQLVGIHVEFVNALRENLQRKAAVDDRLTDVEDSLDELVAGAGQGTCVALLSTQFKPGAASDTASAHEQARRRR